MPDSGLGGIRSARALISDSTRLISGPGRSAFRWPRIPSRVYWIDNHRTRHDSTLHPQWIGGLALRAARSKAAFDKPKTLCDHRLLGLRSGQLRNRIDLIQTTTRPVGESRSKHRQILQPARHPDQLSRSRMTKTEPGRHPLRKIPSPIGQEPLTQIGIDQPVTDLGVKNGQTREQMRHDLIGLIIGETLPLHETQRIASQ